MNKSDLRRLTKKILNEGPICGDKTGDACGNCGDGYVWTDSHVTNSCICNHSNGAVCHSTGSYIYSDRDVKGGLQNRGDGDKATDSVRHELREKKKLGGRCKSPECRGKHGVWSKNPGGRGWFCDCVNGPHIDMNELDTRALSESELRRLVRSVVNEENGTVNWWEGKDEEGLLNDLETGAVMLQTFVDTIRETGIGTQEVDLIDIKDFIEHHIIQYLAGEQDSEGI